jgi:hypothetical protein
VRFVLQFKVFTIDSTSWEYCSVCYKILCAPNANQTGVFLSLLSTFDVLVDRRERADPHCRGRRLVGQVDLDAQVLYRHGHHKTWYGHEPLALFEHMKDLHAVGSVSVAFENCDSMCVNTRCAVLMGILGACSVGLWYGNSLCKTLHEFWLTSCADGD